MKKISNPWNNVPGYNCFGCSPNNPIGLHMEFYEEGDDIVSVWHPNTNTQGWIDTLHGGIQAALADEIASWVVFRKLQTTGVTASLNMRYKKSISTLEDHITLRARLLSMRRNLADIEVQIFNEKDELCASAQAVYFTASQAKSQADGFGGCKLIGEE